MKATLVLLALIAIAYFPALFLQKTFFFGDNYSLMVPGKLFAAASLRSGVLPFWNPNIMSGQPFLADINQSVLYPTTLLFMVLPTWIAVNVTVLGHFFIGALGVYVLVKKKSVNMWIALTAAVIWLFSFTVVSAGNNLAAVQTTAWIPWIYMLAQEVLERDKVIPRFLLALSCILAVLGGHPQPFIYLMMFIGIYVLFFPGVDLVEKVKRFLPVGLLTIGTLAVLIFPFFQLSGLSTRANMSAQTVLAGSLHPAQLATWVIPNLFSSLSHGISWGPSWGTVASDTGYVTVIVLIALAIFTMKKKKSYEEKLVLSTAVLSIVMALGRFIPGASVIYDAFPLLRLFRNPAVILWIWTLTIAVLIAPAFLYFSTRLKKPNTVWKYAAVSGGLLLLVLLVTVRLWFQPAWTLADNLTHAALSRSSFHTFQKDLEIAEWGLFNIAVAYISTVGVLYVFLYQKKRWWLVFAIIVVDLFSAAQSSIVLAPRSVYDMNSQQAAFLQHNLQAGERYISSTGYLPWSGLPTYWENVAIRPPFQDSQFTQEESQTFAVLKQRQANLGPNWGEVAQLPTPFGYSTFVLKNTAEYWKSLDNSLNINEVDVPKLDSSKVGEQSVRYFILDTTIFPKEYLTAMYPHLKFVQGDTNFAVFELSEIQPFVRSKDKAFQISQTYVGENQVRFSVVAPSQTGGELIVAEHYYPGWRCLSTPGNCTVTASEEGMLVRFDTPNPHITLWFEPSEWAVLVKISALSALGLVFYGIYAWKTDKSRSAS